MSGIHTHFACFLPVTPLPPTLCSSGSDDSAAGVTKAEFTAVFAGDTDRCGPSCSGYSASPNTQAVIDRHWNQFKSAAAALGFRLQASGTA